MNGYDVAKWERCKELAAEFGVLIKVWDNFELTDQRGLSLGGLCSVDEVYAFLCGYEHSTHKV